MLHSFKDLWKLNLEKLSRRELFRRWSLLTLPALLPGRLSAARAAAQGLHIGQDV
jgi:hypothetical protein